MEFEWDENKNLANIAKHKIDFNHVFSVFDDPFKIFFKDIKKHSFSVMAGHTLEENNSYNS